MPDAHAFPDRRSFLKSAGLPAAALPVDGLLSAQAQSVMYGSSYDSASTSAGQSLPSREPEGIRIWQTSSGNRLTFGFSGPYDGPGCGIKSFTSSFYYK